MIIMKDTIHEGNSTLRAAAEEVSVPITEEDRQLGEDMLTSLKNSQDSVKAEELQLHDGVGLAASQLDTSKRIIAVHVPSDDPENETPSLDTAMYNPKILNRSMQDVRSGEGEGCLSVDRDVSGYVVRHSKIVASYFDIDGEEHKVRSKNYEATAVQHETDYINSIMFHDHTSKENPFALKEGVLVIE